MTDTVISGMGIFDSERTVKKLRHFCREGRKERKEKQKEMFFVTASLDTTVGLHKARCRQYSPKHAGNSKALFRPANQSLFCFSLRPLRQKNSFLNGR